MYQLCNHDRFVLVGSSLENNQKNKINYDEELSGSNDEDLEIENHSLHNWLIRHSGKNNEDIRRFIAPL